MATQYRCTQPRRLLAVREHPVLNGIEYLEVLDREAIPLGSPRQRTLLVRVVKPLDPGIAGGNVRIDGGVRVRNVRVEWAGRAADAASLRASARISDLERDFLLAQPDPERLLAVRTDRAGDYSTYRLRLVADGGPGDSALPGFDPPLAGIDFSFKVECSSEFDCARGEVCPPEVRPTPPIDYLAKDYASFRQLMLDRLSVIMPDWRDRTPADVGIAIVEVMAYVGDYLSYYQDAVATEAYLGTARRRTSVRRHARLLDYPMHDGSNSRVWVAVTADVGVQNGLLRREYAAGRRTRLVTRVPGHGTVIAEDALEPILAERRPLVFEPLHDLALFEAHNRIPFYTWGDEECCLPRGATRATLLDAGNRLRLRRGDVLIFEEERGPLTSAPADADPTHRQAVRLTSAEPSTDKLFAQPIVEIEWSEEDALTFPLCLSALVNVNGERVLVKEISVARGNVLLADQGRTVPTEPLPLPSGDRRYRPLLREPDVTQRVPFDPVAWAAPAADGPIVSAARALSQDPREGRPDISLLSTEHERWEPVGDLLASDRFEPAFVVETENDGQAALRFGDNVYGRTPEAGVELTATYRTGSGTAGNVGAGAIAHIVTTPGLGVAAVHNPLPAAGGCAPEPLDSVRLYGPQAFRRQERAVTEADYAIVAERHFGVSRAVARRRWTGSWHTVFVTVDRVGGRPVDREFEEELVAWIDRFKLAAHDVEIEPPRLVPLDIALTICVAAGGLRSDVKRALLDTFSRYDLPGGGQGFFHPDRFTFGQPVYLSQVIATAMRVPGVRWVAADPSSDPPGRFQRWGQQARGEIAQGFVRIGPLEIAQLDNDPNTPESGRIEFHMKGGL